MKELTLRYGCNPHQAPAKVFVENGDLPFEVKNGAPGFINLLDAFNAWQLVSELKAATGLAAAASFKHVSPAGAAVAVPLTPVLKSMYGVASDNLSPAAAAYSRARGADRLSSFGDFAAVSDNVDITLAKLLKSEVSDDIIAPSYDEDALEILKNKKKGKYVVLAVDPSYVPDASEIRRVFGIYMQQPRNDFNIDTSLFNNMVTANKVLDEQAKRDLLVATTTLKYTQSNSVAFALDGQIIGVGAGQQSRIHCTRLAAQKAELWMLRHHPDVLSLQFKDGISIAEKDNAIDTFLRTDITPAEKTAWEGFFKVVPESLSEEEKRRFISTFDGIACSSDAFFPFRDNIDRAASVGTKYIAQAGGSVRDDEVIKAADYYGIAMCMTGLRLFHHG